MKCCLCHRPVGPDERVMPEIKAFEDKQPASSSRRGGSDIVGRERTGKIAHGNCVRKQRAGIAVGQETLA